MILFLYRELEVVHNVVLLNHRFSTNGLLMRFWYLSPSTSMCSSVSSQTNLNFNGPCTDPEGGQGIRTPPPPLKNHKNIGFLSNTGPDPLKNHKATKPTFNVGPLSAHQRNAISMPFAGGQMMAHF